jgi:hypothetical protein
MFSTKALSGRFCLLATACFLAGFAPTLHAQLAIKGELLLEENFQQHEKYTKQPVALKPGWQALAGHAQWERTPDGVRSVFKEGHMPVLKVEGEFGDAVIEIDFRYTAEPGRWAGCRVSPTNPVLHPRAYAASVWANQDNDARARGLILEHDAWKPGFITQVDRKAAKFEPGTWYTLRMELVGNAVLASCNGVEVTGSYEKFGLPKTSISLGVGTCPHELRNLRIYAATLNPAWPTPASPKTNPSPQPLKSPL